MSVPVCPLEYVCKFTPHPPKHVYDPWWTGPIGIWAAGAALVVVLIIACVVAMELCRAYISRQERIKLDHARDREQIDEREKRQHALDMAEQLTMALDGAKGSPEMLKIVEDRMKR